MLGGERTTGLWWALLMSGPGAAEDEYQEKAEDSASDSRRYKPALVWAWRTDGVQGETSETSSLSWPKGEH